MVYQGFFDILMITLISSKNLGGYRIMRNTVHTCTLSCYILSSLKNKFVDGSAVNRLWLKKVYNGPSYSSLTLISLQFMTVIQI